MDFLYQFVNIEKNYSKLIIIFIKIYTFCIIISTKCYFLFFLYMNNDKIMLQANFDKADIFYLSQYTRNIS